MFRRLGNFALVEICGSLDLTQILTSPILGSASGITVQMFKSTGEEQPGKSSARVLQTSHP